LNVDEMIIMLLVRQIHSRQKLKYDV